MAGFAGGLWLAIAAAGATSAAGSGAVNGPIHLAVQETAGIVEIQVVGSADKACEARYELEVQGANGGNRSVQRGNASLSPGAPRTLSTVRIGSSGEGSVSATLRVEDCNGNSYEQQWPLAA